MSLSEWKANPERAREEKDAFFAQHWQSPIPPQDRPRFKGLQYYPPDPSYRFELELHEHRKKQAVRMTCTKGDEQDFIRWGEFRFKIGEKEQALQAYKSNREEETLFVPFKDATSGKETYGAGRYLDLEPGRNRTQEGNGFWISIKPIILGVPTVRLMPVPLCLWRTGLRCRYMLGKKTIICQRQANDRR